MSAEMCNRCGKPRRLIGLPRCECDEAGAHCAVSPGSALLCPQCGRETRETGPCKVCQQEAVLLAAPALQQIINELVDRVYWRKIYAGRLCYEGHIEEEMLERLQANYRPNEKDQQ